MSELEQLGNFKFSPNAINEFIKNKNNDKKTKSAIFDIIQAIVLAEEYNNLSVDFGSFEISFDLTKEIDNLEDRILKSLDLLYKLNYQLYRKNYLSNNNRLF